MSRPSKSSTLELLAGATQKAYVVDPMVVFRVSEWNQRRPDVLCRISSRGLGPLLAVRSAAAGEDGVDSPPGVFQTLLGVPAADPLAVASAIDRVVESYQRSREPAERSDSDEVIVQTFVANPRLSGVAEALDGDAYIHVDFDSASGTTNAVTAGRSSQSIDIVVDSRFQISPSWSAIRRATQAVQEVSGISHALIEFAETGDGVVHVFQARRQQPRAIRVWSTGTTEELARAVQRVDVDQSSWSDMADWNPAELLGSRPAPLASSLYCYLITNRAWLLGRSSLGYRSIEQPRLVELFAGKPYVNVGASFLSLTPQSLSPRLAARLVRDRIAFLRSEPYLHDKVETEVLFTAADIVQPSRTVSLRARGFDATEVSEIDQCLRHLTSRLLNEQASWASRDATQLQACARRPLATEGPLDQLLGRIVERLDACRDRRVVAFARHARLAFVARDLLKRLCHAGAISDQWESNWWTGIHTVVRDVAQGVSAIANGSTDRQAFDERFGHLRARTFDVRSPRYDQMTSLPMPGQAAARTAQTRALDDGVVESVGAALHAAGLPRDGRAFFRFAEQSIELREHLKFSLTRDLSDVLEDIALLGRQVGLSREEMAFCSIEDLVAMRSHSSLDRALRPWLLDCVSRRRDEWSGFEAVILPGVIFEGMNLLAVESAHDRPNFITSRIVEADVAVIGEDFAAKTEKLDGKIVAIEAADPGCDWIFSFELAGLITRYGGANSHMAVRCAQLGVAAAIGCGERMFREVIAAKRVKLNCATQECSAISERSTS